MIRQLIVVACLLSLAGAPALGQGMPGGVSDDLVVARLLDEIETGSATETRLREELNAIASRRKETHGQLTRHVRALYRLTRAGRAPVASGFDALRMHVARVARLKRLVRSGATRVSQLNRQLAKLREQRADVTSRVDHARGRLNTVQEHTGLASRPGGPMDVFAQPPNALGALAGNAVGYGFRFSDPEPIHTFERLRGRLSSPVTGEVRITRARREESDGPGLEFQAPAGTPVRAVAAGRVAFSDHYGSYGRLVILDHGDSYYTVYGGLGAIEVRVGDDLSQRARLGSIGAAEVTSALFFEIRKGTRTLEPRSWLGL